MKIDQSDLKINKMLREAIEKELSSGTCHYRSLDNQLLKTTDEIIHALELNTDLYTTRESRQIQ